MRRQFLMGGGAVAAAVAAGLVWAAAPAGAPVLTPLALNAAPVPLDAEDPARDRVGKLHYRGGLVLTSPDEAFGGLSGLRIRADGWALAVSDTGNWVTFRVREAGGRLVGATGGHIAPILDADRRPPADKDAGDAEAVEWRPDGAALVAFEQDHRVQSYAAIDPADPATLTAPARTTVRLPATAGWSDNGGGEALAELADGRLLIFREEGSDAGGNLTVLAYRPEATRQLLYTPPKGYRPTDAQQLPDGRLIVVNRRFTAIEGVSAVVMLVEPAETMRGVEVARFAPPLATDNFEGVAVTTTGARTYVWLLSDDNFMGFQRTLLLKFELVTPGDDTRPPP